MRYSPNSIEKLMNLLLCNAQRVPYSHIFMACGLTARFELIYSYVASTFFGGILFGGIIMGYMMDNYGRKGTAVHVRDIVAIVSAMCMVAAKFFNWIELFVLGQFLAGILNSLKTTLFIYMAECAPDEKRGLAIMTISAGGNLLLLIAAPLSLPSAFGTSRDWWLLPALCAAFAGVHLFVAGCYFPESPKHLFIKRHLCVSARHAIRFYHGDKANIESVIEEYKRERNLIHCRHLTLRNVLHSSRLRWCLAIVLVNACVPATSLVNVKSQYMETMIMNFGLDQSAAMMSTMLISVATAPLCIVAPFLVERFGRRPIFLLVSALSSAELVLVGAAQGLSVNMMPSWAAVAGSLAVPVGLIGFSLGNASLMLGLLSMNSVLLSEMCPHAARTLFAKITQIMPICIALVGVISYPTNIAHYGTLYFLPFLVINILLFVFSIFYLPETRENSVDIIFKRLSSCPVFARNTTSSDSSSSLAVSDSNTEGSGDKAPLLQLNSDSKDSTNEEEAEERSVASYGTLTSRSSSTLTKPNV